MSQETSGELKPVVQSTFKDAYLHLQNRPGCHIWQVACAEQWTFYVVAKTEHQARQAMLERLKVHATKMSRDDMLDAMAKALQEVNDAKDQESSKTESNRK